MAKTSSPPAQLSPPVARATAVLNFLAGHPEQAFTLTEIAKSLRMSSATCHNLLTALAQTGYIYRTAGKTYVLGPALARVARASLAPALVMQVARPEMRLLADEFDVVCSAYRLQDREVVVHERASALSHIDWSSPYLHTIPIEAPLGGMFYAWQDDATIASWLEDARPPLEAERRERLIESLRFMREREYAFGVRTKPLVDAETARQLQNQHAFTEHAMLEVEPSERYQLAYIAAPVFQRPGEVLFGLSLIGFVRPVEGRAVEQMAARLRAACDRIGAFVAGRDPGWRGDPNN